MAVGVVVVVVSWLAASCVAALVLAGAVRLADARAPGVPHAPAPVRLPLPRTSATERQPQEPEPPLAAAAASRPGA